jgi:hypothetical protein
MPEIIHSGRVALSLIVLGAILILLSVVGFLSAGWTSVLRVTAFVLMGGGGRIFSFYRELGGTNGKASSGHSSV